MKNLFLILCISGALSSFGQGNWSHDFGGIDEDFVRKIEIDNSGNIISIGSFEGTTDFDGAGTIGSFISNGLRDLFIMKSDPSGNVIWVRTIGGTSYEDPYGVSVDQNNNILITGRFFSTTDFDPGAGVYNLTSNGTADCFVLMLNASGDFIWAESFGGDSIDYGLDVVVDSQNNVLIMGGYSSWSVDFDPGVGIQTLSGDHIGYTFVLKLNNSGQFIWVKSIESTNGFNANDMVLAGDTSIFLSGYYSGDLELVVDGNIQNYTGQNMNDLFVIKLDAAGDPQWFYELKGSGMFQNIYSIEVDGAGNVYGGGWFQDTLNFIMDGLPYSINSAGSRNALLFSLDNYGEMHWYTPLYSDVFSIIYSIDTDNNGKTYFTGSFAGSLTYNGNGPINSSNNGDIIIGSILPNGGNVQEFMSIDATETACGYSIRLNNSDDVYSSGIYQGTCQFAVGGVNHNWQSFGDVDSYILSLGQSLGLTNETKPILNLYPNPTTDYFEIDGLTELHGDISVVVTTVDGTVLLFEEQIQSKKIYLPFPTGIYFVNIYDGSGLLGTYKVIKE